MNSGIWRWDEVQAKTCVKLLWCGVVVCPQTRKDFGQKNVQTIAVMIACTYVSDNSAGGIFLTRAQRVTDKLNRPPEPNALGFGWS